MKPFLIFIFLFLGISTVAFGQTTDQTDKLTPQDFRAIFQLAIDLPELQQYYHADTDASRKQIVFQFFGEANHDQLKGVTKFDRQVSILSEEEIIQQKIKSYFVVGDWVCGTNSLRLQLDYPAEGIIVSYMFKKTDGSWTIVNSRIEEV